MADQFRISGKDLGELSLPNFCRRCFWIKRHMEAGLPYQIFPGIFSSIDSYSKRIIHSYFDRHNSAPDWLSDLPDVTGYVDPPHHSRFRLLDESTNVLLTGSPDGVLVRPDKSHLIIDYKTGRFTGNQDALYPMYETQLNAYAMIGEAGQLSPVSALALVYTEPMTNDEDVSNDQIHEDDRFSMKFSVRVLPVDLDLSMIPPLLEQARQIYDLPSPPLGSDGCRDCTRTQDLADLILAS